MKQPGIIFDMDGVLVHSNPAHKKALQIFCDKYDKDVTESYLRNKLYGRTNKEWIPELFGDINTEELQKLEEEKEQLFRELFVPEEHVVKGLYTFLDDAKAQDIPMAVATSAPGINARYILSRLSIEDYFAAILDSSHVTAGKPDPEIYIKAAKSLDKRPEACIVFEDSVSGVQAGLDAGAKVVGVTTTHTAEELRSCHLVIDNFNQMDRAQLTVRYAG